MTLGFCCLLSVCVCWISLVSLFFHSSILSQVLRNIVSNAIKFSPEGSKVTIRAFFDRTPDSVSEMKDIEPGDWPPSKTNGKTRASIGRSFLGNARSSYKVFATSSVESSHASQHRRLRDSQQSEDDVSCDAAAAEMDRRPSILSVGSVCITGDTSLAPAAAATSLSGNGNNGHLIIIVSDSGPGISEANQKKLFRSVVQFDPEKNQGGGGSGFGLFISKGIVDLHCGSIAVQSEGEGHGCSFVLAMPMVRADVDPTAVPVDTIDPSAAAVATNPASANNVKSEHAQGGPRRGSLKQVAVDWVDTMVPSTGRNTSGDNADLSRKKYRLLIVDDSSLSRKMLCKSLRFAGHECDEAEDGLIALNKIKEKLGCSGVGSSSTMMYDAVLMDTNMPNLDGPSAAKAMRDCGVTIPIFGVTGNGEEKDIEHYKSQGATAVFVKPFDMNNFVRHMKELEFSKSQP